MYGTDADRSNATGAQLRWMRSRLASWREANGFDWRGEGREANNKDPPVMLSRRDGLERMQIGSAVSKFRPVRGDAALQGSETSSLGRFLLASRFESDDPKWPGFVPTAAWGVSRTIWKCSRDGGEK